MNRDVERESVMGPAFVRMLEARQLIRDMGWTAKRNSSGELWCRQKNCHQKSKHGFGVDTWEEALATVRAEYERGTDCCGWDQK